MDPRVRGAGLVLFFLVVLAFCALPFGESGCVFTDSETTGEITFEAWHSECKKWTVQQDFLNCTRENVDVHSHSGSVILATDESRGPVEPEATVGVGYEYGWTEPGMLSYTIEDDRVPLSVPCEDSACDPPPPAVESSGNHSVGEYMSDEVMTTPDIPDETAGGDVPTPNVLPENEATGSNETAEPEVPDAEIAEGNNRDRPLVSCTAAGEVPEVTTLPLPGTLENATTLPILDEEETEGLTGFNESSPVRDEEEGDNPPVPQEPEVEGVDDGQAHGPSGPDFVGRDELVKAPVEVKAAGTWTHQAEVTITNPGALGLKDYQVKVEVPRKDEMREDFHDIRFTDSDGVLLPHWYDEHASSYNVKVFWVKTSYLPSGDSKIYLHYGNADAPDGNDGSKTFLFYDDFEDTTGFWEKWERVGGIDVGGETQDGNRVLAVKGTGYLTTINHNKDQWDDVAVRERIKLGGLWGHGGIIARYDGNDNHTLANMRLISYFGYNIYDIWISGCNGGNEWSNNKWYIAGEWLRWEWHTEELGLSGGRADLFADGDWIGSTTLPDDAPISGRTGLYANDITKQYRDEHIVRWYSPAYIYLSSGTLTSDIFDTGDASSKWDSLAWDADLHEGTEIKFWVRTSDSSFEQDNTTIPWEEATTPSPVSATALPHGRYLQWRATLSGTDETTTPVLKEVRVWYTPGGS